MNQQINLTVAALIHAFKGRYIYGDLWILPYKEYKAHLRMLENKQGLQVQLGFKHYWCNCEVQTVKPQCTSVYFHSDTLHNPVYGRTLSGCTKVDKTEHCLAPKNTVFKMKHQCSRSQGKSSRCHRWQVFIF